MNEMLHFYKDVGEKNVRGYKLETEECFNIETTEVLTDAELKILKWILAETYEQERLRTYPWIMNSLSRMADYKIVEIGPRLSATTPWATNALASLRACGIQKTVRIERSIRYRIKIGYSDDREKIIAGLFDRMREMVYPEKLMTFATGQKPEPVYYVPIMEEGIDALSKINKELGLGMDEQDIAYDYKLFKDDFKRNPTNVVTKFIPKLHGSKGDLKNKSLQNNRKVKTFLFLLQIKIYCFGRYVRLRY